MAKQKTVTVGIQEKKLKEVIDGFIPRPMPGRFFVVPVKNAFIRKKPEHRIELLDSAKPKDVQTLDKIYYDHPYQFQVVAVGPDLNNGPEFSEKMVIKKGDIIAIKPWDPNRPPPALIFQGHGFAELTQSYVVAILDNDTSFKKVI